MKNDMSSGSRLTTFDRKAQVLADIIRHVETHGFPPSQRELARRLGVSLARVSQVFAALVKDGVIDQKQCAARAYTVNRTAASVFVDRN